MPLLRRRRVRSGSAFSGGRATLAGALFLLGVAAVLFWPLLSGRRTLYFGDLALYFIPQLAFARREMIGAGRLPLWNPYLLCGTPFVGNPQAWPLYPSAAWLAGMTAPVAAGVIGALHVAFAAIGTLLFLRARGRGLAAALVGALAFGFGGALVSKMQFPNMVQAAAFLPWLLWAAERVIARPASAAHVAGLGLVVGLALLAAHAQMFLMQFYLTAAWAVWRVRGEQGPGRGGRRVAARALLFGMALGALLAAGQLLPVAEHVRASVRDHLTLGRANRFTLAPAALVTNFVAPNFWGNPATGEYVGPGNFWEPCAYIGLVPFALALWYAVRRFRTEAEVRFWTLAAVAGLWLALGRAAGLYIAAFYLLPGVNKFNDPARFLHVATFALACLAAGGTEIFLARWTANKRRAAVGALVVALCAADLLAFDATLNPTVSARVWKTNAALENEAERTTALAGRRVLHADNPAAWRRYVSNQTYGPATGRDAEAAGLLRTFVPNLSQREGVFDAAGYEPVRGRASDVLQKTLRREAGDLLQRGANPAGLLHLRAANVGVVLSLAPGGAALRTRLLPRLPGDGRAVLREASGRATPCVLRDDGPDRVIVDLPFGHPGGLLVVADTARPGWQAKAQSAQQTMLVPVQTVNGVFRGVVVPAGVRRVTLDYVPAAFRIGLFVSLLAAGIMGAMFAATLFVRRFGPRSSPFTTSQNELATRARVRAGSPKHI